MNWIHCFCFQWTEEDFYSQLFHSIKKFWMEYENMRSIYCVTQPDWIRNLEQRSESMWTKPLAALFIERLKYNKHTNEWN